MNSYQIHALCNKYYVVYISISIKKYTRSNMNKFQSMFCNLLSYS